MIVTDLTRSYFKIMRGGRYAVHIRRQNEAGLITGGCIIVAGIVLLVLCCV